MKPSKDPSRKSKPAAAADGQKRRHLPAAERTKELLGAALELFAEKGSAVTLQALADRVKVTQPLVHRYFPAKSDLIAAVRKAIQDAHWDPAWREIIADRSRPLDERIADFYAHYLPHIHRRTWYRGFWFFALGDASFSQVYLNRVTTEILYTIIDEARHEFGFPSIAEVPPTAREVELVWGLHSTPIFQGIRRYVYEMSIPLDSLVTVRDQVRGYLLTVPGVMREALADAGAAALSGQTGAATRRGRRSAIS